LALTLETLRANVGGFALTADVTLPTGRLCAVIGPSGAGKSTVFDVIAGFRAPVSGRVLWQGQALSAAPGKRPVAMLFQDNNLFPHLTVTRNLALALTQKARLGADQQTQVATVLEQVGLAGLGDRLPSELSGGQQSRAALARVLLQDRPLWLLDEPFAALGPGLKQDMLALVCQIATAQGTTVLMITHDPRDARQFADTTLLVDQGTVSGPYDTADLLDNPPPALAAYLG